MYSVCSEIHYVYMIVSEVGSWSTRHVLHLWTDLCRCIARDSVC